MTLTAADVVARLHEHRSEAELVKLRRRLPDGEPAIGVRMGILFGIAEDATAMPLTEVERLLAEPTYEARMAAFCVLDFKARRALGDRDLHDIYLRHHDRITAWDMVDRAAPRVVGGHAAGGPYDVLHDLAAAVDPLRRRTAVTAPLWFVRSGSASDLATGLALAARLHADPEPVVHNAVGIFLKHAGGRDPDAVRALLDQHASAMPRPAVRLATEKLAPGVRAGYVSRGGRRSSRRPVAVERSD